MSIAGSCYQPCSNHASSGFDLEGVDGFCDTKLPYEALARQIKFFGNQIAQLVLEVTERLAHDQQKIGCGTEYKSAPVPKNAGLRVPPSTTPDPYRQECPKTVDCGFPETVNDLPENAKAFYFDVDARNVVSDRVQDEIAETKRNGNREKREKRPILKVDHHGFDDFDFHCVSPQFQKRPNATLNNFCEDQAVVHDIPLPSSLVEATIEVEEERVKVSDDKHNQKVFVGGVPQELDDGDLADIFSEIAPVKKAWIQRLRTSCPSDGRRKHRGFGFVLFANMQHVDRFFGNSMSKFVDLRDGTRLEVMRAVPAIAKPSPIPPVSQEKAPIHDSDASFVSLNPEVDSPEMNAHSPPFDMTLTQFVSDQANEENPKSFAHGGRKIFVGGVPQNMTESELFNTFSEFAPVRKAWLQQYRVSPHPFNHRGFGFVLFFRACSVDGLLGNEESSVIHIRGGARLEVKRALSMADLATSSSPSLVPNMPPDYFRNLLPERMSPNSRCIGASGTEQAPRRVRFQDRSGEIEFEGSTTL